MVKYDTLKLVGEVMKTTVLLPADTYIVINRTVLNDQDRKLLISLYQPVIGTTAISLYFSLWSYLDKMELCSTEWTHHHLMGNMGIGLSEISVAREKLEGIGLIKTYLKKGDINHYVYALYSPLSAAEFFANPILTTALYHNVGALEYQKLVEYFKMPRFHLRDYTDITKSLSDVFETVSSQDVSHIETGIRRRAKQRMKLVSKIELDELLGLIPEEMINIRSITKDMRELIDKLSFIYDLDNDAMLEIIRNSLTEKRTIDRTKLRNQARNYYTFEHDGRLPSIAYKHQPDYLRRPIGDQSPRAKMIYQFETTSPYDFLCGKNHGVKPSKNDKLILEYLLIDLGMMPGVVNVLIDYVLRINQNKLTKNFIEVIASQWIRSNVKTVEDAMKLAQKEMTRTKNLPKPANKTVVKQPEWFTQDVTDKKASVEEIDEMKRLLGQFQ